MTPAFLALFLPACLAGIWRATHPFPQRARYADQRTDWQPAPKVAPLSPVAPRRTLASSPTLTPDVCNVILFPGGR